MKNRHTGTTLNVRLQRDDFPGIVAAQNSAGEFVIEGVARLIAAEGAQNRLAQQIQITDGIKKFVLHKLVAIAKTFPVQHTFIGQSNGIIQTRTKALLNRLRVGKLLF